MQSSQHNALGSQEARSAPPLPKDLIVDAAQPIPVQPAAIVSPNQAQAAGAASVVPAPGEQAATDIPAAVPSQPTHRANPLQRFFGWVWHHKKLTIPALLALILAVVLGLPVTRYPILALGLKRPFTITVMDSKTGTPVSGANITLDGHHVSTDSAGRAKITARVGKRTAHITKQYYQSTDAALFVGISTAHNSTKVRLSATGRQVPIKVVNTITGKPVAGAVITVLDTDAKTDANGQATIVLPTDVASQSATIAAAGYNKLSAPVQVTDQTVAANTFAITPAGRVLFLSNLSGKIDVASANLDGTGRQTVLAGTGSEDPNNTVLLATRDWEFAALLSARDGGQFGKLFMITASNGKFSTIDSTAAAITPIGWVGHTLVYEVSSNTAPWWQPGGTLIKSYNADTGKTLTIVTSQATGTSDSDAEHQAVWSPLIMGDNLIYATTWYGPSQSMNVSGQQNTIMSIKTDGTGSKTAKSVDAGQYYVNTLNLANPTTLYFSISSSTSDSTNYYRMDLNGNVTSANTITSDTVTQQYPTYLLSPNADATFWAEQRDGKNVLFTGDATGNNSTQIGSLSEYAPYGWFTDNYLLVQKGGSELYIMPAAGGTPVKIADYFKPNYQFYAFDSGYGAP